MRKIIWGVPCAAFGAWLLGTMINDQKPDAPSQHSIPHESVALTADTHASGGPAVTPFVSGTQRQPPLGAAALQTALDDTSLKGTVPPGIPTRDAQGHLVVDAHLRALLDYFMALDGERDEVTLEHWIYSYLSQHLTAEDVSRAMDVFKRYQALQTQPAAEGVSDGDANDFEPILQSIMATRREVLGTEIADAFFGEDETYDRYTLEKIALLDETDGDNSRTHDWNSSAISALPDELRERQQLQQQHEALLQTTQAMEKEGASAAQIYQYHVLQGNTEIAERYQALAEQRQRWQERVSAYRSQRDQMAAEISDPELRSQRLQQWMASQFSEQEILRIHSIERMEDGS